jgi:anti-anti-sigma regulatory factor
MLRKRKKATLVYFMSETHFFSKDYSILVVNLVGTINLDTASVLHDCQEQILKSTSKWVILNFRDVSPESDSNTYQILRQLRQAVHNRPVVLRIAGIHPDLKNSLIKNDILKEEELFNNLADALQSTSQVVSIKDVA